MKLSPIVREFFHKYLPDIRGTSLHTVKAYRDAFKIFLPFAANYHHIKIASLTLDHICTDLVLAFLDDLEQHRNNIAKTRNHRLAALKSFAKMIRFMHPEHRQVADKSINPPQNRTQNPVVGFL